MLIFEQCFFGLTPNAILSSKDYLFIKHSNRNDSYRIFAKYSTTTSRAKTNTFRKDYEDLLGIDLTNGKEWQWHHVVEGTHIRQLFSSTVAESLHKDQSPTVLINQPTEHIDYNLFHAHGVKVVFDLNKSGTVLSGSQRTEFITRLQSLYAKVYGHDHVLKTVALNVLRQLG